MFTLQPTDYQKVIKALSAVEFNCYFAQSVVEQHVTGKIYVDNTEDPKVFYIFHPYGMSLLLGDYMNSDFIHDFSDYCLNVNKNRDRVDWMQVYPFEWCDVIKQISESTDTIETYERINFKFNREKYLTFRKTINLNNYKITETNAEIFENMSGTVIPRFFWNTVDDFLTKSIGFTLVIDEHPVSTAFAAYLLDNILEIGIETTNGLYGKGYSAFTCCRLIDFCLENNLEPVWACKKDNIGSVKLAQKLGFEIIRTGPYYKIDI
jgi:RimJ/RimL family protein N-acetyltransferase